jgi:hypothetical protein
MSILRLLRAPLRLAFSTLLASFCLTACAAPTPQFFTYYALGSAFGEALDHVNLYWAISWTGDRNDIKAQLREATRNRVRAMLHAEFIFFEGSCPYATRTDAATRWHALAAELAAEGLLDAVVAVYPLDEPDLCGVGDGQMQDVIAIIHAEPLTRDKKVAGLFTVDVAKKWGGHYHLTHDEHAYGGSLRAFDWVGFDCYGCSTIFSETAWDTVRFDPSKPGFVTVPGPTLYDNFKSQLDLTRQQVILVPKASLGGALFADAYDDPVEFYARASADPDVALLLPFTWFDQPNGAQGVRSIPALRGAYRSIGADIDLQHPEVSARRPPTTQAVEFYNAARNHFFVTANADEANLLDTGTFEGWTRTGQQWNVFPSGTGGGTPVCRFYGRPEAGLDSHFYSGSPAECASVAARFATAWILESSNVFKAQLPNPGNGACPIATIPLYRVYNGRADVNHRFSTSRSLRDAMVAQGWIAEGYGDAAVALCVPG